MKLIATYLRDMEPSEAPPDYSSAGGVFPPIEVLITLYRCNNTLGSMGMSRILNKSIYN